MPKYPYAPEFASRVATVEERLAALEERLAQPVAICPCGCEDEPITGAELFTGEFQSLYASIDQAQAALDAVERAVDELSV